MYGRCALTTPFENSTARLLRTEPPHLFDFYLLEDRILLSGEGIDGLDEAPTPDPALTEALLAETQLADVGPEGEHLQTAEQILPRTSDSDNADREATATLIDPSEPVHSIDPSKPLEVVFIDANVEDAQTLIDGVRSSGGSDTQWLIVELDGDEDGIEQISRTLNQLSGVDAIHLVSHGNGQGIQLGQTHLDLQAANAHAGQIAAWANALDTNGDLLVYGCDLASTEAGQDLLATLAALCDCDIAASDDVTGHASLGGDWELEYVQGEIEASIAFHSGAQQSWHGALATYTVTNTNDSGAGSLRQAIIDANANSGQDTIDFNISMSDAGYVDPDSVASSGDEYWTIGLTSFIGWITDSVIIDGTTQLGYDPGTGRPVIELDGSAAAGATTVLGIDANNSTIRGLSIHSSSDEGIEIVGFSGAGQNNVIQGNWIGIDAEGNVDANAEHGIILAFGASNNTIGGSGANEGNYIAGNGLSGIFLRDSGTDENVVIGNVIGVLPDGSAGANASDGIILGSSVANNVIGGTGTSEGNTIANNTRDGISVSSTAGAGNSILGNTIYSNAELGIDLEGGTEDANDVTSNDTNDADSGPNDLQNFPVLTFAEISGTNLTVSGSIDTDSASTQYRIEFFGNASGSQDATHGEASVFLGSTTVTTDGSGDGAFSGVVLSGVTLNAGDYVTATATRIDDAAQVGVDDKLAYGSTSEFAANLSIAAGNVAPVGNDDTYNVNEDTTLSVTPASSGVLANDTDADLDPLTATLVSGPSNAQSFLLNSDGTFTYLAIANFHGTDTFTYRANDGSLDSSLTTVTITVNPVNDAPVISTNTGVTVAEGSTGNVITTAMLNEGDVDDSGAGLTYTITNVTDNGTVYLAGFGALGLNDTFTQADIDAGDVSYDHDDSETTSDAFTFALSDGGEDSSTPAIGTFTFTVTPVNETPTDITPNGFSLNENVDTSGGLNLGALSASDPDSGETFTFSIIGGADQGLFTIVGGDQLHFDDGILDFETKSSYAVTVRVTDSALNTYDETLTVSVNDLNETPVATDDPVDHASVVNANSPVSYWRLGESSGTTAVDASGTSNGTYHGGTQGVAGALPLDSGTAVSFNGTSDYIEIAHDPAYLIDDGTVQVWFNAANTSSFQDIFSKDSSGFDSGGHLSIGVTAAGEVEVRMQSTTTSYYVRSSPGTVSPGNWHHVAFSFGSDGMQLYLDGQLVDTDTYTGGLGTTSGGSGNAETLVIGASTQLSGNLVATPLRDFFTGSIDEVAIFNSQLSIAAIQDLYSARVQNYSLSENATFTATAAEGLLVNDHDPEGSSVTVSQVNGSGAAVGNQITLSSGALVTVNTDGSFTYDTNNQFDSLTDAQSTTDSFTYQIDDGSGNFDTATVTLVITGVNDGPTIATNAGVTVAENATGTTITNTMLNEGDVDDSGAGLTFTVTNVTDNGTLYLVGFGALGLNDTFTQADIDAGDITYDHDGSETSSDGFSFSLADGGENGVTPVTGTFNITITPVNDNDPEITSNGGGTSANVNTAENSVFVTTVTATDDDLPAETLSFSIIGGADAASFSIDSSTGVLSFSSAPNAESPADVGTDNVYDVIVQVSDGTRVDSQSIAVTVTDVDEFDVGTVTDSDATSNAVDENAANGTVVGITALATDADATNYTITYTLDDNAGGRFTINSSSGVVTVADGTLLDRETAASHDITIRATSSDGSFNTATMSINLNDVDEFDVGTVSDSDATTNAIDENAANGTVVGVTALASDADATNNTITYTLDDNAGGRFTINSSSGVVTVADGTLLDREAAASHDITIRATSSDGSFNTANMTINLNDVDEFDVGTVSDSDATTNAIDENAANGTVVGVTALASDADATNNTITYTLDDNAGGRFTINSSSGIVTVADGTLLDREAAASHDITVRATSSDGSFNTATMTINLDDVDEFDVGTVTDSDAISNAVDENAANGTVVGVAALATDADATNNTITYTLDDNAGGRFTINSSSGVVTVADGTLLDRESAASHDITVRATSSDGSFNTATMTINLNDVDEFDVGTITDSDATSNAVDENAANGTVVGVTALASDADATNNTITYTLDDNAGGRFTINSSSGVVTVADGTLLDREAAASHDITVRAASSDGSFNTATMTINLNDVDEFDVGTVTDSDATSNAVDENAANGTAVGVTALASDADATNNTITYTLDDNAGGRFTINSSSGVVTVADGTLLDREAAASHDITVRATSSDGSFNTATMTINLNDVDEFDVGTVTDSDATSNAVDENAANGTVVGVTALATDADATNNTITYTLDDNAGGRFTINSSSGVVTVADGTLLDREAAASHDITVRATSSDGSFNTATMTINLNDVDEFDVGTVTDSDATSNDVDENAANGTVVGVTALASDNDATNNTITYTLDDNAGGRFTINSSSGVVTVADGTLLDREAAASHDITVRATSSDGSFNTATMTINLNDVDEFDVGTVTDSDANSNDVDENATNGTVVGVTALASDADATNNSITYTLDDNAGGRFTINSSSGVVTVADGTLLDREAAASHDITIRATSSDGSFNTATMTINLNDVDEFDVGTVTDSDAATNAIDENAANGTVVGATALASDADATNNTITYTLDDNAGGRFTINSSSGVVTVADGTLLDREAAASHDITVRATSSDGSFNTATMTINLNDVDEFDVGTVTDSDITSNAVDENAANGTVVGITALATDADATNSTITYTLDDNAGGRFTINSSSGVVTVADGTLLDREAAASHDITVRATSSDGSFNTATITINLNDVDEFDVGTVTDSDATSNAVDENAANGTVVGVTALASDADATTDTITYTLDDNAGGRFTINSSSGVVTVADGTLLDREAAASHDITVRATSSDGSFNTATMTINLNDVDEFDVGTVSDSDATPNAVNENAVNGTVVGVTALASDADATNNTITYTLDDNAGGRFTIHSSSGVVTVADGTLLDREAAASHDITVRATSSDGSINTATMTIGINDVNESAIGPVGDSDLATNLVAEDAANGSTVGVTASATDSDTDDVVSYSLDDDAGGRFAIDSSSGVVTVADGTLLDREAAASHDIVVRATSTDGTFSTSLVSINLSDVDEFDVGTVNDIDPTLSAVSENAANGTIVGVTALAADADATNNSVSYSLDDDAGGRFAIDSLSGVVSVADGTLLDREAAASHDITIRATSSDGSSNTATMTIQLNDVDEFDVVSVTDSDITANAVDENAANGTAVGITAQASDADATNNTITYSLDDSAGGRFTIDANSGVVTVNDGTLLDRESAASHDITIRATSSDGSSHSATMTIHLNDVDEFDVVTVTDNDFATNAVDENAANGTAVGVIAFANDADATNNAITYSLDDHASGRFTIDSASGIVTVADGTLLDRESAASHDITIRATSTDGSFQTATMTIAINDVDEFDVGTVTDSDLTSNTVDENAINGTVVGVTALASDADATNNTITYTLDNNAGGRFTIDSNTGIVTVADGTLLDRESAASHDITVRATSIDGSFSTALMTVFVNDVDEFDVGTVSDNDLAANVVDENAANGTTVGVTAFATDNDATNNTVSYSLDDDAGGRFSIDCLSGVVTVADGTLLDRESASSHDITVRATSSDGSFNLASMTIQLNDVDEFDVGSITDADGSSNAVDENASIGTTVGITAVASDSDATNNTVTYALDDDAGGRFAIDSTTGVVTVADGTLLDRESFASHDITVRATSSDGSFDTVTMTIHLNDLDEFDVGVISDNDLTTNLVNENAANGTVVGVTALASDPDATNNTITYSLDDDAGGRFTIDANSGVVTVADGTLLDRETATSHDITVRATSNDGSFSTAAMTIGLADVDEFDVSSITDNDLAINGVDENAANGTTVGITAFASDADATNNTVSYTLDNDAGGRFTIDSNTGVVTVADGTLLDRETAASHDIVVRASSSDGSFQTALVTINVNDIDEFDVGLIVDNDVASNSVAENSLAGTTVGITAFATDPDASNNTITYSLDDSAGGRFAIDGVTGQVTVDGAIDFESTASHNVTVRATSVDGSSQTQVFSISVTDVNEAPVAVSESYSITAGTNLNEADPGVIQNDTDIDGDSLTTILVATTTNGTLTLQANGGLLYTPDPGFIGVDFFDYQASDGTLQSATVRVTITVNNALAPPSTPEPSPEPDPEPEPETEPEPDSEPDTEPELDPGNESDPPSEEPAGETNNATPAPAGNVAVGLLVADESLGPLRQPSVNPESMVGSEMRQDGAFQAKFFDLMLQGNSTASQSTGSVSQFRLMERLLQLDLEQAIVWQSWDESVSGDDQAPLTVIAGSAGTAAGMFSVGYVFWALRGGALMTALASGMPAWRLIDPTALLTAYRSTKGGGESLDQLLG